MLQQYPGASVEDDIPFNLSDQSYFLNQSAFSPTYTCLSEQSIRGMAMTNFDGAAPSSHSDTASQLPLDPLFIYPEHSILSPTKDEVTSEEIPDLILSETHGIRYYINARERPPPRPFIPSDYSKSAVRRCLSDHYESHNSAKEVTYCMAPTAARSRANSCPIFADTALVTPQMPIGIPMPTRQMAALRIENEDDNSMNENFTGILCDQQSDATSNSDKCADLFKFLQPFNGIKSFGSAPSLPVDIPEFHSRPDLAPLTDSYDILTDQVDPSLQWDHSRPRDFVASNTNGSLHGMQNSPLNNISLSGWDNYDELGLGKSDASFGYTSFIDYGNAPGNAEQYHGDQLSIGGSDMLVSEPVSPGAADFYPRTSMPPSYLSQWPSVSGNGMKHLHQDHSFLMSASLPAHIQLSVAPGDTFRPMMINPSESQNCTLGCNDTESTMGYSMSTSSMSNLLLNPDCVIPAATQVISKNDTINVAYDGGSLALGRTKKHGRDDTDGVTEVPTLCNRKQELSPIIPDESIDDAHGIRAAIQRYMQLPADNSAVSLMILTSKVAQKSYGTEKRFLCPPPTVLFLGNGWGRGLHSLHSNADNSNNEWKCGSQQISPSTEMTLLENIQLSVGILGESTLQNGVIEWRSGATTSSSYPSPLLTPPIPDSSAGKGWGWDQYSLKSGSTDMRSSVPIDGIRTSSGSNESWESNLTIDSVPSSSTPCAPPSQVAGTCVSKHLFINDADEKRKRVQVEVVVKLKSNSVREDGNIQAPTTVGCFTSRPITVISKPSKKRQSVKNRELCIHHGTTISLFNRIRSQTVSTRYLGISTSPSHCNLNSPSPRAASPTTTISPPLSHSTSPQTTGPLHFQKKRATRANQSKKKPSNTFEPEVPTNTSRFVARTSGWDPFVIWIVDPLCLTSDPQKHPSHPSTGSSATPGATLAPPAIALQTHLQHSVENNQHQESASSPLQNGHLSNLSTSPSSTRPLSRRSSGNCKVSSPASSSISSPSPIPIHYNQPVILQSLTTGYMSPVMVIRKVDKGSMVTGGLLDYSQTPNATGCLFGEQLGEPISQLQKVAFQIYQYPHSPLMTSEVTCCLDTPMENPRFSSVNNSCAGDPDSLDTPGQYLACLGDVVGKQRAQEGRKWVHPVTGVPVDHPSARSGNKFFHANFSRGTAQHRYHSYSSSFSSLSSSPLSRLAAMYDSGTIDDQCPDVHMSTPQPTQSEFGKVVRKRRVSSCSEKLENLPASPSLPGKNRHRRRVNSCSSVSQCMYLASGPDSHALDSVPTSEISMSTPDGPVTGAVWCEDVTEAAVWAIVGTDAVQYTFHCPDFSPDNNTDAPESLQPSLPVTPVPTVHNMQISKTKETNTQGSPARPIVTLHGENFTPDLTVWFGDIKAIGTEHQSPECITCLGPTPLTTVEEHRRDSEPNCGDLDSEMTGSLFANIPCTSVPVLLARSDGLVYNTGKIFTL